MTSNESAGSPACTGSPAGTGSPGSPEPTERVRVVVYLRAPEDGTEPLERAYREISWVRPDTVPGLLRSELLRDVDRPGEFALHGEWESLEAYRAWQFGPDHKDSPSALRSFQDRSRGRHYAVYGITSEEE